ncbi:hypothetical protein SKAU_G00043880 [Synaphobranchus kaupii]|uniref:Uncharacterized protein n=1 Tax=Synaphobranchus kaupii TaxID=118154 RepID=A0A9Q1G1L9_SYNKA|nr:hypothetical protein SKAU_G00043880 [Synaphobranchus kaupii]
MILSPATVSRNVKGTTAEQQEEAVSVATLHHGPLARTPRPASTVAGAVPSPGRPLSPLPSAPSAHQEHSRGIDGDLSVSFGSPAVSINLKPSKCDGEGARREQRSAAVFHKAVNHSVRGAAARSHVRFVHRGGEPHILPGELPCHSFR